MKKALAYLLLFTASLAFSATIVGSPHDLSNANVTSNDAASVDNGEVCVYCHTPHAANVGFDGAPLWNKASPTGVTYKMYGASTTDTAGLTIANTPTDATPANPSLACLSCHDGISAIDSIVNAPGSGMNAVAGSNDIVTALAITYGGNIGGVPGTVNASGVADLSNDHPVSIIYDPNKASLRPTATLLTDTGDGVAWAGATDIASLLRNTRVECGSCHDPHNGGNVQGTATEVNFLRHSNKSSNLCIGCHNK